MGKFFAYPSWFSLTHYQTTNFRLFQLREFTDEYFKFHENERKLTKQVENTVGKGEIARYERLVSQGRQKVPLCGNLTNYYTILSLNNTREEEF